MRLWKLLGTLAVVAGLIAAAYGAAASLTVNGGVLQAGEDNTLTCQTGPLTVKYTVKWDNGDKAYVVDKVHVSGITRPACNNLDMQITLTKGDGTALVSSPVLNTGTSDPVTWDPSGGDEKKVQDVEDIEITIYSTGP
jgi:hypothetical protein